MRLIVPGQDLASGRGPPYRTLGSCPPPGLSPAGYTNRPPRSATPPQTSSSAWSLLGPRRAERPL